MQTTRSPVGNVRRRRAVNPPKVAKLVRSPRIPPSHHGKDRPLWHCSLLRGVLCGLVNGLLIVSLLGVSTPGAHVSRAAVAVAGIRGEPMSLPVGVPVVGPEAAGRAR